MIQPVRVSAVQCLEDLVNHAGAVLGNLDRREPQHFEALVSQYLFSRKIIFAGVCVMLAVNF